MTHWVTADNLGLLTDYYELTMAGAYVEHDRFDPATFDVFVRSLPSQRSFLVAAGVDDAIDSVLGLRFNDVDFLRDRLGEPLLEFLRGFRFGGDIAAVSEGEVVFPNEPIMRVTAALPEAQVLETMLLNTIGFQTMVASKAARVALAAGGRAFVDFGARRAHGADAALKASKAAFVGGAAGTSLTLAGRLYDLPVSGTMAHSFVLSYDTEAAAFRSFARLYPHDAVFLIDTFDTEAGAEIAGRVAVELQEEGIAVRAVRLDSGDLGALSHSVRRILDAAGAHDVAILASGDLDEWQIADLVEAQCPIDGFGVGTRLVTSSDIPSLQIVYKMVEVGGQPVLKLSPGKETLPGRKQVWRKGGHDVIALDDERQSQGAPLLGDAVVGGTRVRDVAGLREARDYAAAAIGRLPARLETLGETEDYEVRLSHGLAHLTATLRSKQRG